jgi:vacuolar iron transporter family protein
MHNNNNNLLQAMLFGALDGVLTSFAICAGAAGGGLGLDVVLILGFSNILADALSMGVGEYLSSKVTRQLHLLELMSNTVIAVGNSTASVTIYTYTVYLLL